MERENVVRRVPHFVRSAMLALGLAAFAAAAPEASGQAVVTGRVADEQGAPVPFAEVGIERLRVLVATADDGTYRLVVPAARIPAGPVTILARRIGFRSATHSVALEDGAVIEQNFTLAIDPLKLEELVATGQALTATRERLGYTVSSVEAQEIIDSKETNIVAALAGKAPGVWVQSATGDAGGGAFINIRGFNTVLSDNQPLFVVDGIVVDNSSFHMEQAHFGTAVQNRISDLNPEDIESIEVLKGPAASSVYGAAGANGAVLITTKSGRRGVTRLTTKTTYSWDDVNHLVPLQRQYGQGGGSAIRSWGSQLACHPNCVLGVDVFDHAGELFRTGHRATADLNLSGGTERTTYYLSLSYTGQDGAIRGNSELDKTTLRLKGAHDLRENLTFSGNFAYTDQKGDLIQQGSNTSGLLLAALRTPPEFNNCLPDVDPCYVDPETGLHRSYTNPNPTDLTEFRTFDNPFWVANEILNTSDVDRTLGNVRTDWAPLDWLDVTHILGVDFADDDRVTVFPKSSSTALAGRVLRGGFRTFNVEHSLLGTATRRLGANVTGSLSLGQNLRQEEATLVVVQGDNLIFGAEELEFTTDRTCAATGSQGQGGSGPTGCEFKSRVRTEGYFAEANLDLYDQVFVSSRIRNEGSSTFGPATDSRFWYPSVSLAWTFSRLPALQGLETLSFGKVRFAYGVAGKAPPVFANVAGFHTPLFNDGWLNVGLTSTYLGREGLTIEPVLPNDRIEPERTREVEGGLDLAFWDNRIAVGGTYYHQKTTDAIISVPVAPSTGFGAKNVNGAEFENRGVELSLDVIPVQKDNFSWELGAQWSRNDSEVLDLLGAETFSLGGFFGANNRLVKDQCGARANEPCPYGVLWGTDWIRFGRGSQVDLDGDGIAETAIDEAFPGARPGEIYIAADGFPLLDPQERVIGDPTPEWLGSIRSTFRIYKNLRITGLIDIKKGGAMWNGTKGALFSYGTHASTLPYHGAGAAHVFGCGELSRGDPQVCADPSGVAGPGAGAEVTIDESWVRAGLGNGFNGPATQFVEDAGYVKLRDLSISYAFDQLWVKQLGFSQIEVTVTGRNLKTWTDYTGVDPESNLFGQNANRGLDFFNNPQTRSWIVSFNFVR